MENLKQILEQRFKDLENRQHDIGFIGADPVSERGFIQLPKVVIESETITPGAKLTYTALLYYAWFGKDNVYPGHETLAKLIGVKKRSIVTYLSELQEHKYIFIKRRGQGKTNLYLLNFVVKSSKS